MGLVYNRVTFVPVEEESGGRGEVGAAEYSVCKEAAVELPVGEDGVELQVMVRLVAGGGRVEV